MTILTALTAKLTVILRGNSEINGFTGDQVVICNINVIFEFIDIAGYLFNDTH